jgi:hypothetical protein
MGLDALEPAAMAALMVVPRTGRGLTAPVRLPRAGQTVQNQTPLIRVIRVIRGIKDGNPWHQGRQSVA